MSTLLEMIVVIAVVAYITTNMLSLLFITQEYDGYKNFYKEEWENDDLNKLGRIILCILTTLLIGPSLLVYLTVKVIYYVCNKIARAYCYVFRNRSKKR